MNTSNLGRIKKGNDVLLALKNYGPLTRKTLSQIVPSIKNERNFRRTLNLLCRKKIVCKRFENLNGGQSTVYQLNQNLGTRDILSAYLNCKSEDLLQKDFRYRELFHEQVTASLSYRLKSMFPDSCVYRDYQLHLDNRIQNVLPHLNSLEVTKPDVLMSFWNKNGHSVSIVFEFERTAKSKIRLMHKLKMYAAESLIDGVVYIASSDQIISNLREVYNEKVLEKSLRIKHYGNNFLLCSVFSGDIKNSLSLCLNSEMKTLQLQHWISILTKTKEAERRNSLFS